MDLLKTAREIGFFETGKNLADVLGSEAVKAKAGAVMPLPDADIADSAKKAAEWLAGFGKSRYLFLTPELAVIEKLALLNPDGEAIILLPCSMEHEVKERIKANLPGGMRVRVLEEPYFPEEFSPGNGILVISGYLAANRSMALPETYRMIEHYGGFWGKKVFLPYTETEEAFRYAGWMEAGSGKFTAVWRR